MYVRTSSKQCIPCNCELSSKYDLTVCVCVLNEIKMYKFDELLEWLVYSTKWKALLTDNILYIAAVHITILVSVTFIN